MSAWQLLKVTGGGGVGLCLGGAGSAWGDGGASCVLETPDMHDKLPLLLKITPSSHFTCMVP